MTLNHLTNWKSPCFDYIDTLSKIMTDRDITYCSYYLSYRDCDGQMFGNITSMIESIKAQVLEVYKICLGPMAKEDVNCLVSETLVSVVSNIKCNSVIEAQLVMVFSSVFTTKLEPAIEFCHSEENRRDRSFCQNFSQRATGDRHD